MSNYTQTTSFTPKDSLTTGNPAKIIKGADFDVEFAAISAAVSSKADSSTVSALTKADVGLGNVDNTSDLNKPVSTAQQTSIAFKRNLLESVSVISGNTNAVAGQTYIMTATLVLTLPATPAVGNWVSFQNSSGVLTCSVARNGSNIMSLAEDLTVDVLYASFTLVYADATRGWVFA